MLPHVLIALAFASGAFSTDTLTLSSKELVEADAAGRMAVGLYRAEAKEVSNWRTETVQALEPKPVAALAALFKAGRPVVTRCVKLNNYWCIKSARWDGEVGKDEEGHVGFASADRGADAAATLLRRYYLDFNRKSALDIVRRWAPAECNIATGIGGLAVLAVRGIGGTVRAKWLASNRGVKLTAQGKSGQAGRVSIVIPLKKTPSRVAEYRVPDIAAGMGERPKAKPEPQKKVAVPKSAPQPKAKSAAAATASTATSCVPDEQRLRNYASRMVEELGMGPTDDLKLFLDDGTPSPNLAPVMLAMSSFELGMLRASPTLVERAIARAVEKVQASAKTNLAEEQPGLVAR